jgi:magnesium transporter
MRRFLHPVKTAPGDAPGIEHHEITNLPVEAKSARITCVDYSPSNILIQDINDLDDFLTHHRPEWCAVRWINVAGLSDMNAIHALATKYSLHPLAIEDVLHANQRPKVEPYGGEDSDLQTGQLAGFQARLFIITRALRLQGGRLQNKQVSIFLGHSTVLTFQEVEGDEWNPIHQRLKSKGSRLRSCDASYLAYSLMDAIVDRCFPILEYYGDRAEELEDQILEGNQRGTIHEIHQLKRDLLLLRWAVWPMREVIATLRREPHECVSETTRIYLNDLYDHIVQIIDIIETYREMTSDLTETYMTSFSNRMGEVMKVLTVIGTIFIPLTFLAGVYGMNFRYFPELDQPWAYPVFWIVCVALALGMLALFRRRSWL